MCGVALGAGVVTGKLTTRTPSASGPIVSPGAGLSDELALTPAQRDQMRQIWESVRDTAETCSRQAQTAQTQMQAQLIGMLTNEQKARYEKLSAATRARIDSLNAYRRRAFKEAVDQTMRILNPDRGDGARRRVGTCDGSGRQYRAAGSEFRDDQRSCSRH